MGSPSERVDLRRVGDHEHVVGDGAHHIAPPASMIGRPATSSSALGCPPIRVLLPAGLDHAGEPHSVTGPCRRSARRPDRAVGDGGAGAAGRGPAVQDQVERAVEVAARLRQRSAAGSPPLGLALGAVTGQPAAPRARAPTGCAGQPDSHRSRPGRQRRRQAGDARSTRVSGPGQCRAISSRAPGGTSAARRSTMASESTRTSSGLGRRAGPSPGTRARRQPGRRVGAEPVEALRRERDQAPAPHHGAPIVESRARRQSRIDPKHPCHRCPRALRAMSVRWCAPSNRIRPTPA